MRSKLTISQIRKSTDKNCQERETILRKLFILFYLFIYFLDIMKSVQQVKVVQKEVVNAANLSLN